MRWRLYYGDGSVFDGSCEEDAWKAPVLPTHYGIQIYKEEADNERGYSLRHGCTFYCWQNVPVQRWGGHDDLFGLSQYLLSHQGPQKILLGREIYDGTYKEICRRAVNDGSFDDHKE